MCLLVDREWAVLQRQHVVHKVSEPIVHDILQPMDTEISKNTQYPHKNPRKVFLVSNVVAALSN